MAELAYAILIPQPSVREANVYHSEHASRYLLFSHPTDDEALEDLEQPPPSPGSDDSLEIMVKQTSPFHATMARGVARGKPPPHEPAPFPAPAMTASPVTTAPLASVLLLLFVFHFLGIL